MKSKIQGKLQTFFADSFRTNSQTFTYLHFVLLFLFIAQFCGLFVDIYGLDACQYAEISREMLETGNYLQIYLGQENYLDKPPLHFWLTALSFKLLGLNNFAYRFPSFVFSILTVYSTFKIAYILYNKSIAQIGAVIFASSLALFMLNMDVRTDTLLLGVTTFATWQFIAFRKSNRFLHIILGGIGAGAAMLTKGPLGLMLPMLALGSDILWQKDWKGLFKWQWLVALFICLITISPMLYGLYTQWDLHPEKWLFNKQNVSGIKFYFWDQSFGRLTGDNPFANQQHVPRHSDPTFFIHTLAWAVLPWTLIIFWGLGKEIKSLFIRKHFSSNLHHSNSNEDKIEYQQEKYTLGAIILPLIAFSLSSYKLPHYIFICLPYTAIIGAKMLHHGQYFRFFKATQVVLSFLFIIGIITINTFAFSNNYLLILSVLVSLIGIRFIMMTSRPQEFITGSALVMVAIHLFFNLNFYPQITSYDSGKNAGNYLREIGQQPILALDLQNDHKWPTASYSLEFYGRNDQQIIRDIDSLSTYRDKELYIFTDSTDLSKLLELKWVKDTIEFQHFEPTKLNLKFLYNKTRQTSLDKRYLVKI